MQLAYLGQGQTLAIPEVPPGGDRPTAGLPPEDAPAAPQGRLVVHLAESGVLIPVEGKEELTLGRFSQGQPVVPDVDLSAHKAYENGVSRLHAVVRLHGEDLTITDLGSSNGTYVNGVRLMPNRETAVARGDLIALGKLRLHIMANPS
jgi:pSer/pThr/pTyr-binding forkhead associated (FHA) protein